MNKGLWASRIYKQLKNNPIRTWEKDMNRISLARTDLQRKTSI